MKLVCPMSKFSQAPFARAPFWRMPNKMACEEKQHFDSTLFISATDPPLFLGVDACRDPGEGRFRVGFWSVE